MIGSLADHGSRGVISTSFTPGDSERTSTCATPGTASGGRMAINRGIRSGFALKENVGTAYVRDGKSGKK